MFEVPLRVEAGLERLPLLRHFVPRWQALDSEVVQKAFLVELVHRIDVVSVHASHMQIAMNNAYRLTDASKYGAVSGVGALPLANHEAMVVVQDGDYPAL